MSSNKFNKQLLTSCSVGAIGFSPLLVSSFAIGQIPDVSLPIIETAVMVYASTRIFSL